jgi:ATP synthase protein I
MDDDDEAHNRRRIQIIASYITLPFVLAVPPIVGWYIGSWLDLHFKTTPYIMYIFLLLGVASGAREFYRIVTKYKDEEL